MKGYVLALAALLACSCAWSADMEGPEVDEDGDKTLIDVNDGAVTTTVEVKDGTVVVKSSAGEVSAKTGETVVIDGQNRFQQSSHFETSRSFSKITVNGKTIEVSGEDCGNAQISSNNGQVSIKCGDLTLTGDMNTLKSGDKTYDISKSNTVKIMIKDGQVEVDAKEKK